MYSTSRCRHSQRNWDAGRSTASLNHCFIVTSFRERLGSKLAARRHHGRAPAASWFQVDVGKRPFVIDPTLPQLQRCLGDSLVALAYSNSSFSSQKEAATHGNTSHVDSKFKNAIPETETAYIIRPHTRDLFLGLWLQRWSFPGSCVGGENRAWYALFAHAQFSQDFWKFP